jgi:hypothetical protein
MGKRKEATMIEQQMEWRDVLEMKGSFGDVLIVQDYTYRGPLKELREVNGHIVIVLGGRARWTANHKWEPCDPTHYECRIDKTAKPIRIAAYRVNVFAPEIGNISLCPVDDPNGFKKDQLAPLRLTPSSP